MEKVIVPFKLPFNALVVGETNSGKSTVITKILLDMDRFLEGPKPTGLILCFNSYQTCYEEWKKYFSTVHTFNEIPEDLNLEPVEGGYVLVADDLQKQTCENAYFLKIITAGRHMGIVATFTLWHTLFPSCKNSRILSQNFHMYAIMRSPRLAHQVQTLGTQLGYCGGGLKAVYNVATRDPYSTLFIDQTDRNRTDMRLNLRSNIFPDQQGQTRCYAT